MITEMFIPQLLLCLYVCPSGSERGKPNHMRAITAISLKGWFNNWLLSWNNQCHWSYFRNQLLIEHLNLFFWRVLKQADERKTREKVVQFSIIRHMFTPSRQTTTVCNKHCKQWVTFDISRFYHGSETFGAKLGIFFKISCFPIFKRRLGCKENNTKYRSLSLKPRRWNVAHFACSRFGFYS